MTPFYRRLCAVMAAALIGPANAAAAQWQLIEATYIPLPLAAPSYGTVCSAYDSGVCANVNEFYQFNHKTLQRVTAVVTFSNQWGLRLSFTTGAQATKLALDPRLQIGILRTKAMASGRSLSAEAFSTLGGDTRHKPCLDEYDREYFCGSLTAWSDYPGKRISFQEYGIKVLYRF